MGEVRYLGEGTTSKVLGLGDLDKISKKKKSLEQTRRFFFYFCLFVFKEDTDYVTKCECT